MNGGHTVRIERGRRRRARAGGPRKDQSHDAGETEQGDADERRRVQIRRLARKPKELEISFSR